MHSDITTNNAKYCNHKNKQNTRKSKFRRKFKFPVPSNTILLLAFSAPKTVYEKVEWGPWIFNDF
jgi:hypothetical protein